MSIVHHDYYVDEAGDLTLFDKSGRIIIGHEGISKVFMVGVAHIPDPKDAFQKLEKLRTNILSDSYFQGVPSIQPENRKTAVCFHAKDDLPEVRREVFKLLKGLGVKVQVAVRRKMVLASIGKFLFRTHRVKIQPDDIYDDLVKRLFKNMLHKADENVIIFARRGKSSRQDALDTAIEKAKADFEAKSGMRSNCLTKVSSGYPSESPGLQIIDYYLWALQRLYERGEDRFYNFLAGDFKLVMDLDDTRNKPDGEWYFDANSLTLEKIMPVAG